MCSGNTRRNSSFGWIFGSVRQSLPRNREGESHKRAVHQNGHRDTELAATAPERKSRVGEPLAVIGMACRFPGAEDLPSYLRLLQDGTDAVVEVPPDRWDVSQLHDPDGSRPGKTVTRWGGFLPNIDLFNAQLFGITPREANRMDPQQRLLAEVCWEAFEQAGLAQEHLVGSRTGVYVGIGGSDYSTLQLHIDDHLEQIDAYTGTGNAHSIAANRLSYLFDLRGPSLAVDTACSSSLVALHLACQSLRSDECEMAVVGGVNVMLTPEVTIAFSQAHMLSPDGRCKPFDVSANGYVRGEGCGVVIVKRLADAERDGDRVLAVIRGTAVNQDGRTTGIAAPSASAQQAVVRAALADAGVTCDQLSYVEAHGTGTPLGDPIEVNALRNVLGRRPSDADPCYFGSVKSNIGHLETASGIASLIKVVLMLEHREIYRQLHLRQLNPELSLDGSSLRVATEHRPWLPIDGRRLAGVNSFGFGGTNVHVVVEECHPLAAVPTHDRPSPDGAPAVVDPIEQPERPLHVLPLTAHTPTALEKLAQRYLEELPGKTDRALADVCFSAATGRSPLGYRVAVSRRTPTSFASDCRRLLPANRIPPCTPGTSSRDS